MSRLRLPFGTVACTEDRHGECQRPLSCRCGCHTRRPTPRRPKEARA